MKKTLSASALALTALIAAQASVRVGGSAFSVNGQLARDHQYSGVCPVDLKFDWGVISTAPATATYSITRSDGGHSSHQRAVTLPEYRSVPIIEEWHLGANTPQFADFRGWVELNIESPNPVTNLGRFPVRP